MTHMKKVYLGDSVYAAFDGFHVVLTTENGYGPSNTIALDQDVQNALLRFMEKIHNVDIHAQPRSERTPAVDHV